jgi:hypothetical protein
MIVWVVALAAEAQPVIERRGLRRAAEAATPWPLYLAAGGKEALVVCGVGRAAAAGACDWVHGRLGLTAATGWLNAGIAGHSSGPVGRALVAHRVIERSTDRAWYPPPLPGLALAGDTLYTVDRPESEYSQPGAYDMEAAGFLLATARLATAEAAQVVKVVSDSPEAPARELSRGRVSELIACRWPELASVAAGLGDVVSALDARAALPLEAEPLLKQGRFSVTQRRQLRRLLERHSALGGDGSKLESLAGRPAAEVLDQLARWVECAGMEG